MLNIATIELRVIELIGAGFIASWWQCSVEHLFWSLAQLLQHRSWYTSGSFKDVAAKNDAAIDAVMCIVHEAWRLGWRILRCEPLKSVFEFFFHLLPINLTNKNNERQQMTCQSTLQTHEQTQKVTHVTKLEDLGRWLQITTKVGRHCRCKLVWIGCPMLSNTLLA